MENILSFLWRSLASVICLAVLMGAVILLTQENSFFMKRFVVGHTRCQKIVSGWRSFWTRYFKSKIRFLMTYLVCFVLSYKGIIVAFAIAVSSTFLLEILFQLGCRVKDKKMGVGLLMTIVSIFVVFISILYS